MTFFGYMQPYRPKLSCRQQLSRPFSPLHTLGEARTLLRVTKFIGLRHESEIYYFRLLQRLSGGVWVHMPMSAPCKYLVVAVTVGLIVFTLQEADAQ